MKIHRIIKGMAMAAVAAMAVTTAQSQQVTVSQIPGYHADDGEFNVAPIIGQGYDAKVVINNGFETFCVSRTAYLSILPGQYFGTVDLNGIHQPENVVITKGMAWLYSRFATGILTGYDYADTIGQGRINSAYKLQLAIWILEGQYPIESIVPDSNQFLNDAIAFFGGLPAAMAPNTPGDYSVGVLNLNVINGDGSIGGVAQPVLILIPCTSPDATITAPVSVNAGSTGNTASVPDAGTNAVYAWTISNGSITAGQGTPSITWTAGTAGTTILGVTITNAGGCNAIGSKAVTVVCTAPDATITTPVSVNSSSTNNTASVPNAGAGATYVWTISNGSITAGQGTSSIKFTAGISGATILNVTITTADGCDATGFKMISLNCVTPNTCITAPITVTGGKTNNTASVPNAGPGATYVWTISNGTITSGQGTTSIKFTAGTSGTIKLTVTVTVAGGCSSVGCKTICIVCVKPDATITAPYSVKACTTNNTASVANAGAGATYVWTITNGKITSGQGTACIKWTPGLYGKTTLSVKVTSAGGCYDTDCKWVCITSNYNWSNCDKNYANQCISQSSSWGSWGWGKHGDN